MTNSKIVKRVSVNLAERNDITECIPSGDKECWR